MSVYLCLSLSAFVCLCLSVFVCLSHCHSPSLHYIPTCIFTSAYPLQTSGLAHTDAQSGQYTPLTHLHKIKNETLKIEQFVFPHTPIQDSTPGSLTYSRTRTDRPCTCTRVWPSIPHLFHVLRQTDKCSCTNTNMLGTPLYLDKICWRSTTSLS